MIATQFHQRVAKAGDIDRRAVRRQDDSGDDARQRRRHVRSHQVKPRFAGFGAAAPFGDNAVAGLALRVERRMRLAGLRIDDKNRIADRRSDPELARRIDLHIVRPDDIGEDAGFAQRAIGDRQREDVDAVSESLGHIKRAARLVGDQPIGEDHARGFQLSDRGRIARCRRDPEQRAIGHGRIDGGEQAFFGIRPDILRRLREPDGAAAVANGGVDAIVMLIDAFGGFARQIGAPDRAGKHIGDEHMGAIGFKGDPIGARGRRRGRIHIAGIGKGAEGAFRSIRRQCGKAMLLIRHQHGSIRKDDAVFGPVQRAVRRKNGGVLIGPDLRRVRFGLGCRRAGRNGEGGDETGNG